MNRALRERLVPELRARGFKGSLPHLHRIKPSGADYLTVQFWSAGGRFAVEIAKCSPDGRGAGYDTPLNKLNPSYFSRRLRLGSSPERGKSDHWFEFGRLSYEPPSPPKPFAHYEAVAASVVPFIDAQAEKWWNDC